MPVSSTKSMTGHMLGAAGATEPAITALAMCRDVLPPTINQFEPRSRVRPRLRARTRRGPASTSTSGLSNGFGFGGHNASLVFERWDEATAAASPDGSGRALRNELYAISRTSRALRSTR